MKARPIAAWLCAIAASGVPLSAGAAPEPAPGSRGTLLATLSGSEPREIPVRYIGCYPSYLGPHHDLHLVELEGPEAERVGVANGMSGSPVYFDGELLGALSYRMGVLPKQPIAGVTPLADLLDAGGRGALPATGHAAGLTPIATPVFVGDLAGPVREWLAPQLETLGLLSVAGAVGESAGPPRARVAPGQAVGIELVRGDLHIAASGTVTLVDGDVVYAFGHPLLGAGPVELPLAAADVIHTLADWAGSYHLVNLGAEIGAILEDRRSAIVGRLGHSARMAPVHLAVRGSDYHDEAFDMEVVVGSSLTPLLVAASTANSLILSNGYRDKTTLRAHGALRLEKLPALPIDLAFAGVPGTDPALALAGAIHATLAGLWANPHEEPRIESLELEIDVRPDVVSYVVESVNYERGRLAPGQPLTVHAVLREHRGERITRTLELALPERLPRAGTLTLAVGSPSGIENVLGDRIARRVRSATDLSAVVEALAELRSAHRLTAVVYEPGGSVVSRGTLYSGLPPTAEKLLGLERSTLDRRERPLSSSLARAEVELDGPVQGGLQVRLRVERGTLPREGSR